MGFHCRSAGTQFLLQRFRRCLQGIGLNGSGYDGVIAAQILLRFLRAQNIDQAGHQPLGMTVPQRQIVRRAAPGQLRHIQPVGHEFTQHGIHHAGCSGAAMALGHLHRLIDGGAMRDLIHKQDLISADPQDIQDQRLQPLRLLRAPQTDIVVQIHAVLDHAVGDTAGQRCVAAVQAVFGDGPLQAAVRPCVGTGDAQQHLQRGIAGITLSLLVHTFVFTGCPARYAAAGIRLPP